MQVDPMTGLPRANAASYALATRPGVPNDPIEGASVVHHGNFYYLFVSVDYCCNGNVSTEDYKEAVGRSTSPQGPFVDMDGTAMTDGGGTVILEEDGSWNAPGGGTAYVDAATGESLLVFHALQMTQQGAPYLWVKHISWQNDWPVLM
jgi:arabinan endo-1,5-alpha-L-arabinosidase